MIQLEVFVNGLKRVDQKLDRLDIETDSDGWITLEGKFPPVESDKSPGPFTDWISGVLLRYSEWVDADQGLFKKPKKKDTRTHEDLVEQFLSR